MSVSNLSHNSISHKNDKWFTKIVKSQLENVISKVMALKKEIGLKIVKRLIFK